MENFSCMGYKNLYFIAVIVFTLLFLFQKKEDKFSRKDIKTPYEFGNYFSISTLRTIHNSEEVV